MTADGTDDVIAAVTAAHAAWSEFLAADTSHLDTTRWEARYRDLAYDLMDRIADANQQGVDITLQIEFRPRG
ncbi:hypothetical protein FXW78_34310 [Rhodococcus opacus]|nr:hypothetical protein [Rhodococcus opacus]